MSNSQLWLAIGVPTVAVLLGILLNQVSSSRLENRLSSLESRLTAIEGDLRRFYQITGEHSAKIENLEKK